MKYNLQLILVSMILIIKLVSSKPFFLFFWQKKEQQTVTWAQPYPDTKWCTAQPVAENDNDVGEDEVTDGCCKAHQQCPNKMAPGAILGDLINDTGYDVFSCECEEAFRQCLRKNVDESKNEDSSDGVGQLYFNGLSLECFKEDHTIIKCVSESANPKRCIQYELDMNSEKSWQWFDVNPF